MLLIHNRPRCSTRPVTTPKSARFISTPATAAPESGSNATTLTAGSIWGCQRSGNAHTSLRSRGIRGARASATALRGVTIATQIRPSVPVEMLSGMAGRCSARTVTVPALDPVSQYFDSRRPCVSANTSAVPSRVAVSPLAKYRLSSTVLVVPSGSRLNSPPSPRASMIAPLKLA